MEQSAEVDGSELGCLVLRDYLYHVRATDDVLKMSYAKLRQIFARLLGKEREEVDHVFGTSTELGTKGFVLRRHTYGTRIGVALTHHQTAEHDERQRAERELVCTEHCHDDDVACRLELSVSLKANLIAQTVEHQRLLSLSQTYLGRYTGKSH